MGNRKWVNLDDVGLTQAMDIPGGALVRNVIWDIEKDCEKFVALVFVPGLHVADLENGESDRILAEEKEIQDVHE